MPQEPTVNEYLDWIRVLLDEACKKLERDINAAQNQFAAREQTGVLIRKVLDLGKQHFDRNLNSTLHEMHRLLSRTSVDRRELTEDTIRELTNFLDRTKKSILGSVKRRVRGGVSAVKLIDQEMQALDRSLQLKTRQIEGLSDLIEPAKPKTGSANISPKPPGGGARGDALFAAFFAEPSPKSVVAPAPHETTQVSSAARQEALAAGSTSNSPIRKRAEEARILARALHHSVSEELESIKAGRRNERDAAPAIDYLTNVAGVIDQIAMALGSATSANTSEQRTRNFEEAETLAFNLANAAGKFARDNDRRIIDFGGNTILILLGTALFTTIFGVSPDLAFDAQSALLDMTVKTK